jgi:hypothetical protein
MIWFYEVKKKQIMMEVCNGNIIITFGDSLFGDKLTNITLKTIPKEGAFDSIIFF